MIQVLIYNLKDRKLRDGALADLLNRNDGELYWLDIEAIDSHTSEFLKSHLDLHPLAVDSCFDEKALPKVEIYPQCGFILFDAINFNPGHRPLDLINLYCFLGHNYLVTVHSKPLRSISRTSEKARLNPQIFADGVDFIFYELLNTLISFYFPIIDKFEEEMSDLEDDIFKRFEKVRLEKIFALKKSLVALRRSANPQRAILSDLSSDEIKFISPRVKAYLRDIYHQVWRITDTIDTLRDMISTCMESYMTIISNRMNSVMKTLSLVATIVLPLTVLTGIFGMNFSYIPGQDLHDSFYFILAIMLVLAVAIAIYFRKKRWF